MILNFKKEKHNDATVQEENQLEEKKEIEVVSKTVDNDLNNVINIPTKLEQDKVTLDLVTAVNQYIKMRQVSMQENALLESRLAEANDQIKLLKDELSRASEVILERDKQIASLEQKLTDKNSLIDQMIEDNNEIRTSLTNEVNDLKNMIVVEQKKYKKLSDESEQENNELRKKLREYEDKIRHLESEKSNLIENYNKLREENRYLMNTINDFTNRMSTSFSLFDKDELKDIK